MTHAAVSARLASGDRVGRFEVNRELGRGAQGAVFLATDTRLGREVALKTLDLGGLAHDDAAALMRTLIAEARIVATLQHPNIVTLYDAGEHAEAPYLVFEYVEGQTLAAIIRERGRLAPPAAVDIALALARGVGYAHAREVVHRDLKPANVIVTAEGVARLTDFGIARRGAPGDDPEAEFAGTPSYMAPEYISGGPFTPAADLFALGVMLYEMLTGARPVPGSGPREIMRRIVEDTFRPPSASCPDIDERLDAIVMKLLAKRPQDRYATAASVVDALTTYLDPETPQPPPPGAGTQATVEFLLRRIRHKSDFPALSATIGAVNKAAAAESEPASVLSNAILKDFALTNRLLKLVNAAHFGQFGGAISTVSRAVSILGFNGVKNVAASLLIFDHLQNKANAAALKDELVATYFSGLLTRDLAAGAGVRDLEQAFICAMFHRLGRLMVIFYLHDEAQAIAGVVQARGWDENRAAREVLGIGYEDLGVAVGRAWHFPDTILAAMRPLPEHAGERARSEDERLHVLAGLATGLAEIVRTTHPRERGPRLAALVERYGRATGVTEKTLSAAVEAAAQRFSREASILGFSQRGSPFLDNARQWDAATRVPQAAQPAPSDPDVATLVEATQLLDSPPGEPGAQQAGVPGNRRALLAAGVQDISNTLVGESPLNDVLRMVLETIYRGIGFTRVLLFLLDPGANALRCRFGFGADAEALARRGVTVPLGAGRDIFSAALQQGADVCIEDIDSEKVKAYVPDWYRKAMRARGMVLLPIVSAKRTVGLIYGDADNSAILAFAPEELNLLKTLRNQALLAMRQRG